MGALAALLMAKGMKVSGSDIRDNQITAQLQRQGVDITIGHDSQNIVGADVVVYSSAIGEQNPELLAAKEREIFIMQRAKLLAELMQGQIGITVAGAHGKTTTTSMICDVLLKAGLQPTTAIGGIVQDASTHARLGSGDYFVAEVDESDGSFLYFSPNYSVITNVDLEHLDYFQNWDHIENAYRQFIDRTADDGMIIANGEDERLIRLLTQSGRNFTSFGFSSYNDIFAANIKYEEFCSYFDVIVDGQKQADVQLSVPGQHNVANALACLSLGLNLSIKMDVIVNSLKEFSGVKRRFHKIAEVDDIMIIDDYAHHPTEIKTTLDTAQSVKHKRLIAVFQPHRYSRLKGLFDDFVGCLTNNDYLIVTDIYAASEEPIEGLTSETLCDAIKKTTENPVVFLKKEDIVDHLLEITQAGDLVITLGAGDLNQTAKEFVEALKAADQWQETESKDLSERL